MITILIGKSGSGKDTIQKSLVEKYGYEAIVSTTSRPIREGELEGVNYHYISKTEFEKGILEDKFLEYRMYNTLLNGKPDIWYYGSEKIKDFDEKDYVCVLDIEGAKSFINFYGLDNCTVINITIDDATRKERAMNRGGFDESEWNRRLADDNMKFKEAEKFADFTCENKGSVEEVTSEIYDFLSEYCQENDINNIVIE